MSILLESLAILLAGASPETHAPSGAPAFDLAQLAVLAGEWVVVDPQGEDTDFTARYAVVAGGAAVLETLLAGTAHETVTLYHQEGKDLTATQVSRRGTPVRLVPKPSGDPKTLRLEAPEAEAGLQAIELRVVDAEHARVAWTVLGEEGGLPFPTLELRRDSTVEGIDTRLRRLRSDLDTLRVELDRRMAREVLVEREGERATVVFEKRTQPPGPGWDVHGVPFRRFLYEQTVPFASTFAAEGDEGLTLAHYGFHAGRGCRLRFSVLGGHAYIAVVEEEKSPAHRIRSIEDFSADLLAGAYGPVIERVAGSQWDEPRAIEWDLSRFEGKRLRLYVVDAITEWWGQIGISEVAIVEEREK